MTNIMKVLARIGDKAGSLGALGAAMGCSMCFPAIASLGAAIGVGFLSQWEWTMIGIILPMFAGIALLANALGWFSHRQWHRSLPGMLGPVLLLLSLYPWFKYGWSAYVTYSALGLMIMVSLWDIFSPANKHCEDESCAA